MNRERRWIVRLAILGVLSSVAACYAQMSSAQIVQLSGRDQGLCFLIGCGSQGNPALAAQLASSGKMLVHGIALDDAALLRARQAISAAGVDGLATVEGLPLKPLPYRDNLANLVVVEDFDAASTAGFSTEEALRVLAPNGRLLIHKNGKWDVTAKPMPKEMDEWTHESHGPDGSCVSMDKVVHFPVGFRWHAGLPMNICNPKQTANTWSSIRGLALVGGRCFALATSVLENLGPTFASEHGVDHYVTARDAFNGLLLWRKRIGPTYYGGLFYPNRAPFAAVGDSVYVVSPDGKLLALSTATGEVTRTFATTFPPGRLLIDQGVVAVATWKNGTQVGGLQGVDRRRMDFGVGEGTVEAFDAQSGKRLWQIDKLATSIRSAGGILFMVQRTGPDKHEEMTYPPRKDEDAKTPMPPRPECTVVAVDLRTGKLLWEAKSDVLGADQVLSVDAAGLGAVAIAHDNGVKTSVLSAKDGALLFQAQANSYAAFYDGAIHLGGKKYDPATGKETGPSSIRLPRTVCTPYYFVNNMTIANRAGMIIVDGKGILYGGARGGCLFASIPAYGAFYTPQNWCMCAPAQIPGFIVFGPIPHEPSPEEMAQPPLPEKGPAFAESIQNPQSEIQNRNDWPLYRHDPQRSNATPCEMPKELDVLWRKTVTAPAPDGLAAFNWKEYLNSPLTAPVAVEGLVAVAAMDRGQVIALDPASGKELWRCTVGGRVDTPPTICQGICLFGSHDGYVYALACKDGRHVWRMRAAPREERMVSYGKVESPWPVVGTVLVADGIGYASAGHTQGSDGGIVIRAFEPATGKVLWSKAIAPTQDGAGYRQMRRNDLMLKLGDAVQLMVTRMNAKTGEFMTNLTHEYDKYLERQRRAKLSKKPVEPEPPMTLEEVAPGIGLEGYMSAHWTRLGNRKYQTMDLGNISGDMLSWDGKTVCAILQGGKIVRAVHREKVKPFGEKLDPAALRWDSKLPDGYQATAVILCGNGVVVGGGIYPPGAKEGGGFVRLLSLDKGEQMAERTFPAPLTYNGIAVSYGRLYATFADGSTVCLGGKGAPEQGK